MHDDIDRRTSSRARSRAQLFLRRCNYDAKIGQKKIPIEEKS